MTQHFNPCPKPVKAPKKPRKRMKARSGKPKTRKSVTLPMVQPHYLDGVRGECCYACGRAGPSDPHHCKDRPPFVEAGVYRYFPGASETSADADAIPLCRFCHNMYHRDKAEFHARYGVDYQYIPLTRANLSHAEIDF